MLLLVVRKETRETSIGAHLELPHFSKLSQTHPELTHPLRRIPSLIARLQLPSFLVFISLFFFFENCTWNFGGFPLQFRGFGFRACLCPSLSLFLFPPPLPLTPFLSFSPFLCLILSTLQYFFFLNFPRFLFPIFLSFFLSFSLSAFWTRKHKLPVYNHTHRQPLSIFSPF